LEKEMKISPGVAIDYLTGRIEGAPLLSSTKTLGAMLPAYADAQSAGRLDPDTVVYRVKCWLPVEEGTAGGLFIGTTTIEPGKVGEEYFMTQGHFHATRDRAEFYLTLAGEGGLILMGEDRRTRWEPMLPGTVHYIPGAVAHRVANTGSAPLSFLGCWPSDAGHDYETIRRAGFGARLREVDGRPSLVAA
jgi:glucose-6-phosphate isomerase